MNDNGNSRRGITESSWVERSNGGSLIGSNVEEERTPGLAEEVQGIVQVAAEHAAGLKIGRSPYSILTSPLVDSRLSHATALVVPLHL